MSSYFLCDEFKEMEPYIPGEQPKDRQYIKLNANESSIAPSPKILEALTVENFNKMGHYSDPHCVSLRKAIGDTFGFPVDQVFVGNGADEVLGFCFMSFFSDRMKMCFPDLTYDFYRTYAKTNRIDFEQFPVNDDFTINVEDYINTDRDVVLANPNNPTGLAISVDDIERIVASNPKRIVIIDEAYVDYGNESCVPLVKKYSNLVVVQTFSKSRNLAGARIGFAISSKEIISDMSTIKFTFNPFNMSGFALAVGAASIQDTDYLKTCVDLILSSREKTKVALESIGFEVLESHTNFLMASHPDYEAPYITGELKEKGILVRHFGGHKVERFIRITIGTPEEMTIVVDAIKDIIGS